MNMNYTYIHIYIYTYIHIYIYSSITQLYIYNHVPYIISRVLLLFL